MSRGRYQKTRMDGWMDGPTDRRERQDGRMESKIYCQRLAYVIREAELETSLLSVYTLSQHFLNYLLRKKKFFANLKKQQIHYPVK